MFSDDGWSVSSDLIKIFNDEKEVLFDEWEVTKEKLSVAFENDVLVQEFIHEDEGIEQTFTVKEDFGDSFTLVSELDKDAKVEILPNGDLKLTTENGEEMFMTAPKAWDANDKVLDAKFRLDDNLNIEVSGAEAYPVFIDPLWWNGKAHGNLDNNVPESQVILDSSFGYAIARAGDINNDGYQDVLIGAPNYSEFGDYMTGKIYLFLGSGYGINNEPDWAIEGGFVGCGSPDNDSGVMPQLGWSVSTAGDMNNDGYDDFAVGEPGWKDNRGRVVIFFGSADGVDESKTGCFYGSNSIGARLGHAILGDLKIYGNPSNDLYEDLVVSAPYEDDTGAIYVVQGESQGFNKFSVWSSNGGSVEEEESEFGYSLAKISNTKIAVGSPEYEDGIGIVSIWRARSIGRFPYTIFKFNSGPDWTLYAKETNNSDNREKGARFGHVIHSDGIDMTGEGNPDLLIGAPNKDELRVGYGMATDAGKAYLWDMNSEASAPDTNPSVTYIKKNLLCTDLPSDHVKFGSTLSLLGNIADNNGRPSLAIGAQSWSVTIFNETNDCPETLLPGNYAKTIALLGETTKSGYNDFMIGGSSFGSMNKFPFVYLFEGTDEDYINHSNYKLVSDKYINEFGYNNDYYAGGGAANFFYEPAFQGLEVISGKWYNNDKAYLVVGSPYYSTPELIHTGKWYVFEVNDQNTTEGGMNGISAIPKSSLEGTYPHEYLGISENPYLDGQSDSSSSVAIGDFNGDNIPDIAIGSPMSICNYVYIDDMINHEESGFIRVYLGSEDGYWFDQDEANCTRFGYKVYDGFGCSLSAGDIDLDGYDDLLIGSATQNYTTVPNGSLYIYPGNEYCLSSTVKWNVTQPYQLISYGSSYGLKSMISRGSLNNDEYPDIVVADHYKTYIYNGNDAFYKIHTMPDQETDTWGYVSSMDTGYSDGHKLLVIGKTDCDNSGTEQGCVEIFKHHPGQYDFDLIQRIWAPQEGSFFGKSISTIPIDGGSGASELAVGAPRYHTWSTSNWVGKVYLYEGNDVGGDIDEDPIWTSVSDGTDDDFDYLFGAKIKLERIDTDGYADLISAYMPRRYQVLPYGPGNNEYESTGSAIIFKGNYQDTLETGFSEAQW